MNKATIAVLVAFGFAVVCAGCGKPLPSQTEKEAFLAAALECDVKQLEASLEKYSNAELLAARDKNGFAALHLAAMRDAVETVELLISKGADINVRTTRTVTLRNMPRENEFIFDFVGRARADTGHLVRKGSTPLDIAEIYGADGAARTLRNQAAQ